MSKTPSDLSFTFAMAVILGTIVGIGIHGAATEPGWAPLFWSMGLFLFGVALGKLGSG